MKIYDISMSITEGMPVYKNREEKRPRFEVLSRHQERGVQESRIIMDLHTGTHLDAPLHMIKDGQGSDFFPVEMAFTSCRVLELLETKVIGAKELQAYELQEGEFILFKTRNSLTEGFNFDFTYLSEDGARYLVEKKVKGVGIDALGIEREQPGHPTHKLLFQNKILILEGLRLKGIEEGYYKLLLAPLKIKGYDAAPARVFLIKE